MRMKTRLFLFAFIAGLLALPAEAGLAELIQFNVLDADSDIRLSANVTVDGRVLKSGRLELPADAESPIAIEVVADAGNAFYERRFNIFVASLNERVVVYNLFLAKRRSTAVNSRGTVEQATRYFGERVDRGVVLLERIRDESPTTIKNTQFEIHLLYNLGRAYYDNCTRRFVDQCGLAKDIFEQLRSRLDQHPRIFEAERLDQTKLTAIDVERQTRINQYRRAIWDVSRGRFDEAIQTLDELIALGSGDVGALRSMNISLDQLKKDLAFAQSRKAVAAK